MSAAAVPPPPPCRLRLTDRIVIDLNWLPAGEFRMGARGMGADEEPPHLVRLSGFYMGIFHYWDYR